MKKFEYKTVEVPVKSVWTGRVNHETLIDQLNALGTNTFYSIVKGVFGFYLFFNMPSLLVNGDLGSIFGRGDPDVQRSNQLVYISNEDDPVFYHLMNRIL